MDPRIILTQAAFVLTASTGSDYPKIAHLHQRVIEAFRNPELTYEFAHELLVDIRKELKTALGCEYVTTEFTGFAAKCRDLLKLKTGKVIFDPEDTTVTTLA